ncbi:LOW QUALITY PROTEIN: ankyrin repeat domain-containing protein 34B [Xenentodon cancila]
MGDSLLDRSPLTGAASSGKLRLVRLLVEGGAQVNDRSPRGETALLAPCKAPRREPAGSDAVKLITYLLQNKADPNAQDQAGRAALMYACMNQAGAQVASGLLAAGEGWMESASHPHSPTQVLMDACRARGSDIIILATETGANGDPVTGYLNVPPSLHNPPVSCMSPSDIVLNSPNSEGEDVFNFRVISEYRNYISSSSRRHPSHELSPLSQSSTPAPTQRKSSVPLLAIHNLASLNRDYKEDMKRSLKEKEVGLDLRKEEQEYEEEKILFPQSRAEEGSMRPTLLPPLPLASSATSPVAPPASCYNERSRRTSHPYSAQLE